MFVLIYHLHAKSELYISFAVRIQLVLFNLLALARVRVEETWFSPHLYTNSTGYGKKSILTPNLDFKPKQPLCTHIHTDTCIYINRYIYVLHEKYSRSYKCIQITHFTVLLDYPSRQGGYL